eukprot:227769-Amorphochlora_amoeboformis.AAC.2
MPDGLQDRIMVQPKRTINRHKESSYLPTLPLVTIAAAPKTTPHGEASRAFIVTDRCVTYAPGIVRVYTAKCPTDVPSSSGFRMRVRLPWGVLPA